MNLHTKSYFLSTRGWDQFKKRTYPCRASPCRSCTSEPSLTSRGLFLIPINSSCPSFALAATRPSQLPLSVAPLNSLLGTRYSRDIQWFERRYYQPGLDWGCLKIFSRNILNQGWIVVVSKYSQPGFDCGCLPLKAWSHCSLSRDISWGTSWGWAGVGCSTTTILLKLSMKSKPKDKNHETLCCVIRRWWDNLTPRMWVGQFDTVDNLTLRTIWHHHAK